MIQTSDTKLKRTPLAAEHEALGAKMVDFAGWWMPVQYNGLVAEHLATRQNVGLFDVSHMGEIRVRGSKALATLEWLTTNNVTKLATGEAHYSLLPNPQGGLVDDIIIYCLEPNSDYLVCVNAANTHKDWDWFVANNKGAELTNESDRWSQIAIQGPKAHALIQSVTGVATAAMKPFRFVRGQFAQAEMIVTTTGYTGEPGAEIFVENKAAAELWRALIKGGGAPVGLAARDTLRTEMKYSLYGHEIDDHSNPIEAGLGWVVKGDHKDYIGKQKVEKMRASGARRVLVGFKMAEKGIPRQGYTLHDEHGVNLGAVTSGTHSPSLNEPIGIGYVPKQHSGLGSLIWVDIRGRKVKAIVCKTPFYAGQT